MNSHTCKTIIIRKNQIMKNYILLYILFFVLTPSVSVSTPLIKTNIIIKSQLPDDVKHASEILAYNLTAKNFRLADSNRVLKLDVELSFTGELFGTQLILRLDTNIITDVIIEDPIFNYTANVVYGNTVRVGMLTPGLNMDSTFPQRLCTIKLLTNEQFSSNNSIRWVNSDFISLTLIAAIINGVAIDITDTLNHHIENNLTTIQPITAGNSALPKMFRLNQNYPNPFNPGTVISYQIPNNNNIILKIYDINGKEVTTLVNEYKEAGEYKVTFNGNNVASGVYYYQIESGDFKATKKMFLVK